MPHKSGTVEKRDKNGLNLRNVFNVSTILIDTQMQTICRLCDSMPYGANIILDTCNNAVMNNLYCLQVPEFPVTLYIIQRLYFILIPGENQHLKYANANGSTFLFCRFVSNVPYCRLVQTDVLSYFFVKNTFTMQRKMSVDISR